MKEQLGSILLAAALAGACSELSFGPSHSEAPSPPLACAKLAQDDKGIVAAFFTATVGAIKRLPAVDDSPQLTGYADEQVATVCYVDGNVPKAPPPRGGSIAPSYDRAVMVVVGDTAMQVTLGYKTDIPTTAP